MKLERIAWIVLSSILAIAAAFLAIDRAFLLGQMALLHETTMSFSEAERIIRTDERLSTVTELCTHGHAKAEDVMQFLIPEQKEVDHGKVRDQPSARTGAGLRVVHTEAGYYGQD
jgi:hypothetical protein